MKTVLGVLLATAVFSAYAFDLKGHTSGVDVSTLDLKGCVRSDLDGIPGYSCQNKTTLSGLPADLHFATHEGKVALVAFVVKGDFRPTLMALAQKHGLPDKPNEFINKYVWR